MYRLSTDVGGTFTDGVLLDETTGRIKISKVLTTPANQAIGTIEGINKFNVSLGEVTFLVHGTTAIINALIESKGAKTALITTEGFRDILEIGRSNRLEMYDALYKKPDPLIPRFLRFGVRERINAAGEILVPLDMLSLEKVISELKRYGVEAVAVCLLNAYANPKHEEEIGQFLQNQYPEIVFTLSHQITRRYYEYERVSTTVQNAYVMPAVRKYLQSLEDQLNKNGYKNALQIMQSNGGVMTSVIARTIPIAMVESGPAAGAIGAAALAALTGHKNVISYDMGGTTAKTALITRGMPETADTYVVEERPILLPVVDLREIGAGGGSIAWIDEAGALHVGPQSAGADPGPACYRNGGTEPTVTDANLHLGLLNPQNFLGGEMEIDANLAKQAIAKLAAYYNISVDEAAFGIIKIVNTNMSALLQSMTVKRGYDPREFVLVAYGGAGPLHASAIAQELGIPKVIVPMNSGVFSAWGMLMADLRHDFAMTHIKPLAQAQISQINSIFENLEERLREIFKQENVADSDIEITHLMDLRYLGQEHTLSVTIPNNFSESDKIIASKAFDDLHLAAYGHNAPEEPKEVVSMKAIGIGKVNKPNMQIIDAGSKEPEIKAQTGERMVYRGNGSFERYRIFRRENLLAGNVIYGPAVIEEITATTVVESSQVCTVDQYGNLIITQK
ncbi:MAG: hydantoinase/oxoprolinase family protein [Chloroflexi bacterium]|nr:hydantoinase/oxoprolinase family protein [Chloroflexota bacterium]